MKSKFMKQYSINLSRWKPNPYIKIKYIYINELSSFFSYLFFKLNLSPNLITFINIFLAFIATFIFILDIREYFILGIFIFFSKNVLDNADGFIARIRKKTSKIGSTLDMLSGEIYYFGILISLCFHNYYVNYNTDIFYALIIIFFLDIFNKFKKVNFKNKKKKLINQTIIFKILKSINYDGRTIVTDIILVIMILEIFVNQGMISNILIYLFIFPKALRNLYYLLK